MEVLTVGNPTLRKKSNPVKKVNGAVRQLMDRMLATMYAADGVGLAAPQVGVSKRVIVIDIGEGPIALANPELLAREGEELGTEGCLSVPGKAGEVKRAKEVRVTGLDRDGQKVWLEGKDLLARAFQHEIDHLEGILFTDRAERVWDVPPETTLRIIFMGTPDFAVRILERLSEAGCHPLVVVTQPDRPRGRGLKPRPSPVKAVAEVRKYEVLEPETLRDPEVLEELAALRPDVIVVAAYGKLLPQQVLDIPKLGCLNVHPSLLPAYRGAAPMQWALMKGETETGVCIMHMARELDAGDVALHQTVPILPDDTYGSLSERLARVGAELLLRTLRLVAGGEVPRRPQDHARATYAPPLTREEERIPWDEPAARVVNRIRALSPRPGARTLAGGEVLKILRAKAVDGAAGAAGIPGMVVEVRPGEGFVVAAGEGRVLVEEVQPAGGRPMSAAAFLNGHPLQPGDRLGAVTTPASSA